MNAGSALRAILRADSVLGPIVADNVYPDGDIPDNAVLPIVEYAIASATPNRDLAGRINDTLAAIALRITTATYAESQTILDRLPACMDAARGSFGGVTIVAAESSDVGDDTTVPIEIDGAQAFVATAAILLIYA